MNRKEGNSEGWTGRKDEQSDRGKGRGLSNNGQRKVLKRRWTDENRHLEVKGNAVKRQCEGKAVAGQGKVVGGQMEHS